MQEQKLQIHGSMFVLLKKFVDNTNAKDTWTLLLKDAVIPEGNYAMHMNYPASDFFSIVRSIAKLKGVNENEVKERFGEYLVPDLLQLYKAYVNPEWKTFDMLLNTELVMHKAVRKEESKADPPVLNISRVHDKLIMIDYYSRRKMASLAIGIIKGIAHFYNETGQIQIIPTSDPDDERVQIRVEFV
jgi:hypothetical protein